MTQQHDRIERVRILRQSISVNWLFESEPIKLCD